MLQMELSAESALIIPALEEDGAGSFTVVGHDSIARSALEARIRSSFGANFGACVTGFMPRFAYYEHRSGATGVVGIRRASEERLFLESYLDRRVEEIIRQVADGPVNRVRIVEVGQFVIDDRDIVGHFFHDLVPFLADQGFDWVCFTGTDRIRAMLKRVGLNGLPIATADARLVENKSDSWGTYYEHDPLVIVGSVNDPEGLWCGNSARAQTVVAAGL